jgi:hypothetical protein
VNKLDRTATGYNSDRSFVQWFFTKSHGRLLLWSEKSNTEKTRIEVLFINVAVVNIPIFMPGLNIRPVKGRDAEFALDRIPKQMTRDKTLFQMSGTDWDGYVVAGKLLAAEADRDFEAPSDLLEPLWSSPFPRQSG